MSILIFLFSLMLNPINMDGEQELKVEVFDIQNEEVVKTVPHSSDIQQEAEIILNNIDDLYKGISPIPENGFMVKIPLRPNIELNNDWLNTTVDTIIVIFPENEKPYVLTFDEQDKPYVFWFQADTEPLLQYIEYEQQQN
ncbi:hypothetical protein [Aquisalibacillus elongatus]|uniref:Uncharacterized protein n=1 Tax=Aquisalibacillus elongatus TaxID=485577 RepID=A0A3N5BEI5_9BACI|nr:hypothetical protein [Aquisalibacillus elongatus]RPF55857.1 hypothetical protein EDC24_0742 [Aquisalibacillus elongatus]